MKTLILIFVLLVTTCLFSTIINVPGDQPTIQEGIVAAVDTDTVLVADGTYFENIDFIEKAITVASNFLIDADTLHIENTIINGSQATDPDYGSCARFISGEDTTSVIIGFTLTEGTGTADPLHYGGGIYCLGSSPKIISNIITNNSAEYGGGVDCSFSSNAIILNNVISYNTATENMGGLTIFANSNAYVEGNIISNNTAIAVGGVLIQTSSPTFVNNIICNNTAETYIGGFDVLHSPGTDRTTIENCQIYGNTAGNSSGGLQLWNANVDVINCTIYNNHAGSNGGGVFIYQNSDVSLSYTSIYDNSATTYGSGIYINENSNVTLSYVSIYGNSSLAYGGGIYMTNSVQTITNCTIYDNEASNGGNQICYMSGGLETKNSIIGGNSTNGSVYFNTSTATFNYCDFYNSGGPDFSGSIPPGLGDTINVNANGDPCDVFMNIFLDPLFVDPANDDFHLTELSPCIDAGDPDPQYNDPNGTIADIGRYYYTGNGIEENSIVRIEDYLKQNYPNPFNPQTTINYQLPENSNVELIVYNLKGQKVKTLVDETLESGNHTVIWNGKDDNGKSVSSGIYFYKLKTDNFEKTKKMILMK